MFTPQSIACLVFLHFLLQGCSEVSGDGNVLLRFESYYNKEGTGINGHCCDGKFGICQKNGCDHKFKICLHDPEYDLKGLERFSDDNIECAFGRADSIEIKNRNVIKKFGNQFGGLENPMAFPFYGALVPKLKLMVEVWDDDDVFHDDFVEMLSGYIDFSRATAAGGEALARGFKIILSGRTRLIATVRVQCSNNWYGTLCDIFCEAPGTGDKYTCDPDTGMKVCQAGYTGPNCEEMEKPPTTTPSPTPIYPEDECVGDCTGLPNGDYKSCLGCDVYVTCVNGLTYDQRPCPKGTGWNDLLRRCDYVEDCMEVMGSGEV